jgi:hypothetical protein
LAPPGASGPDGPADYDDLRADPMTDQNVDPGQPLLTPDGTGRLGNAQTGNPDAGHPDAGSGGR